MEGDMEKMQFHLRAITEIYILIMLNESRKTNEMEYTDSSGFQLKK